MKKEKNLNPVPGNRGAEWTTPAISKISKEEYEQKLKKQKDKRQTTKATHR